jgi:hypothetical protein
MVTAATLDPRFRSWTLSVVAPSATERDYVGEANAVARVVRRMRYTRDPVGVELFTDPRILAQQLTDGEPAAGDCDDFVGLACSMLETLGHPTRFRVGGDGGGRWRHIWYDVWLGGRWRSGDDTEKMRKPGWDPSPAFGETYSEPTRRSMRHHQPAYGATPAWMLPPHLALGGLEGFKLKKAMRGIRNVQKKVARKVLPKQVRKAATKVGKAAKKALPVAAIVANVIPGVGQVASAALTVAAVAVRQRQAAKAAKAAAAAEQAAMEQQVATDTSYADSYAPSEWPEPVYPGDVQDTEWVDDTAQVDQWAVARADEAAAMEQRYMAQVEAERQYLYGLGDFSSIASAVASMAPALVSAAQSGAFGSRLQRNTGRIVGQVQRVQQSQAGRFVTQALPRLPWPPQQPQPRPAQPPRAPAPPPPASSNAGMMTAVAVGGLAVMLLGGRRR